MSNWLNQPHGLVEFDPAFPRPSFAFNAAWGPINVAIKRLAQAGVQPPGKYGVKASGDSFRATPQGRAYKVVRAIDGGLDFGVCQPITSNTFTVIAVANGAADVAGILFSQRYGALPYNQMGLNINQSNSGTSRPGGFVCLVVDTSVNGAGGSNWKSAHSNSTTLVDGKFHVYAATKASITSTPVLWYDKVKIAATGYGTSVTTFLGNAQKTKIGNAADYGAANGGDASVCLQSDVTAVLVFDGLVLPDPLMYTLSEVLLAPYRVWRPVARRILVPETAAIAATAPDMMLDSPPGMGFVNLGGLGLRTDGSVTVLL